MPPAVPSTINNNNHNKEREERLRGALKIFILRERQRKKEEFEAKVEEERLRKEREARERQNDMTLEETRGQIVKLDQKLADLRNEKQQLFLQLKKVLNEDETRKKLQKDNELFALQTLQAQQSNLPTAQVFLPPVRVQHHQMPILLKPVGNQSVKRGRSPSPPSHQGFYKTANYATQKLDDGRRGADFARILWNKAPTQYQSPGTLFYQTTSNGATPQAADTRGPAIIYPAYNLPLRQGFQLELQPTTTVSVTTKTDSPTQKPTQVFHINLDQPPITQASVQPAASGNGTTTVQTTKPQVTIEKMNERFHVEIKSDTPPGTHQLPEGVVYTPLLAAMPLHTNVLQISGTAAQTPKSSVSITPSYTPACATTTTHDQQLEQQQQQQQQNAAVPGQAGSQAGHNPRRLF